MVSFTSPLTGSYVTARYKISNVYDGMFIDNFGPCTPSNVEDLNVKGSSLKIYPNPVSATLNIELPQNEKLISVMILNQLGQMQYAAQNKYSLNTSAFANGLYYIEIKTDKSSFKSKFLKEKS